MQWLNIKAMFGVSPLEIIMNHCGMQYQTTTKVRTHSPPRIYGPYPE